MSGEQLRDGVVGAHVVMCNDYEFEILRQKTGLGERELLERADAIVVTRGEKGASILEKSGTVEIPAVPPRRLVDPTGVGDAFRGGLMKGLAAGLGYEASGRLGSVAATYVLEHLGGSSHTYTWDEFKARYEENFGKLALGRD